jgi:C_GCAxxG_C_C family probable redox protein
MMARVKDGDRAALLQEAEAVLAAHGDKSNCAERVFLALRALTETDIPAEAVCLLTGLGGGVGGVREGTCGAVTGAVAALGLVHGRPKPPEGDRLWTYEVCRDFVCRFQTAFGATACGALVGDLLREATKEADERRKARCRQYTLAAVRMGLETLERFGKASPGR